MPSRRRLALCGLGVLALGYGSSRVPPLALNITDSLPIGVYVESPIDRALRRGDVIALCLSGPAERFALARGYLAPGPCGVGSARLQKVVVGVPGDVVDLDVRGLRIDGKVVPNGRPIGRDAEGRAMREAVGRRRLVPGTMWVWTPNPRSFDSRYFGPVPQRDARMFERLVGPSLPYEWSALVPQIRKTPAP